jgi:hypothetical protein
MGDVTNAWDEHSEIARMPGVTIDPFQRNKYGSLFCEYCDTFIVRYPFSYRLPSGCEGLLRQPASDRSEIVMRLQARSHGHLFKR